MTIPSSKFSLLLDLAKETSGEKRRELLLQITDIFLADPTARTDSEAAVFDDIFQAVAADLERQVRAELARRIANSDAPVGRTARRLALDVIEVARPVIEGSRALRERDILDVIDQKGADHHIAVTKRPDIGERVSRALVAGGRDRILFSLLENNSARIDRETFERIADRAEANPVLHAPFVKNHNVPLDLLNQIYLQVGDRLRREILRKFREVSASELEAALEISRNRLSTAYGALPPDFQAAADFVAGLEHKHAIRPPILVDLLREGKRTAFFITFAKLVGIEFGLTRRLVESRDIDTLAMLCRCAGFDRALFVTLCLLIGGQAYGMAKAEAFGQLYEQVPIAAAQRAIRFWKVRIKESAPSPVA